MAHTLRLCVAIIRDLWDDTSATKRAAGWGARGLRTTRTVCLSRVGWDSHAFKNKLGACASQSQKGNSVNGKRVGGEFANRLANQLRLTFMKDSSQIICEFKRPRIPVRLLHPFCDLEVERQHIESIRGKAMHPPPHRCAVVAD